MQPSIVIALYLRISREETLSHGSSLRHQRLLLQEYLSRQPEFAGCTIAEYTDNGWSGQRKDRPAFNRMIGDVLAGRIHVILVKDFSRFSRDYREAGYYLEQFFPSLSVRFISVNDHYDSLLQQDQLLGLENAFLQILAYYYSCEVSEKMRQTRTLSAGQGQFVSAAAPYGYQKSSEDPHKLAIEEAAADTVRYIYNCRLAGLSAAAIASELNRRKIPSPIDQQQLSAGRPPAVPHPWPASAVLRILHDRRYTGAMVSLSRRRAGLLGPGLKSPPVIVPHTHPAILPEEIFEQVQHTFAESKKHRQAASAGSQTPPNYLR